MAVADRQRAHGRGLARSGPTGLVGAAAQRFRLVVLLGVLAGAALTGVVADGLKTPTEYVGAGTYVVNDGKQAADAPLTEGINANTNRAARNFVLVLRKDRAFLGAVATPLGLTVESVEAHLQTYYLPGSSSFDVRYTASTEAGMRRFFAAFDAALRGPEQVTANVVPGTIRPLRLRLITLPGRSGAGAGGLAILLGLGGGLMMAVLLERAAPRVGHVSMLDGLGRAVTPEGGQSADEALMAALLDARGPLSLTVTVWSAHPSGLERAAEVVQGLAAAGPAVSGPGRRRASQDVHLHAARLGPEGAKGDGQDLSILLVEPGESLRAVRRTVDSLGRDATFVVLRSAGPARRRAPSLVAA